MGGAGSHRAVFEGPMADIEFQFPYALKVLPETLDKEWENPRFAKYRDAFPPEHLSSKKSMIAHVQDLMKKDVKVSYLKSLQGHLWEEGYASGDLKAPLFRDVSPKMSEWHKNGLKIMIYSSGSVPAQKLLFKHTDAETSDLTPLISDWFDTVNAGLKTETSSYITIAENHKEIPVENWLFLSDNVKEVDAALAAGMQSMVVQRPGNAELPSEVLSRLTVIETFGSLDGNLDAKKLMTGHKRERSVGLQATEQVEEVPEPKKPKQASGDEAAGTGDGAEQASGNNATGKATTGQPTASQHHSTNELEVAETDLKETAATK